MKTNMNNILKVYCDGACSGNPGIGGWAYVIPRLNVEHSGFELSTTNNRMEIQACIECLEYVLQTQSEFDTIEVITDSQYVVNTMTRGWQKKKNTDLWDELEERVVAFQHRVIWTWVKGHASNKYNERCDKLAVAAYNELKEYLAKTESDKKKQLLEKYGKPESILGVENISLLFRPYEKYTFDNGEYVIIYQCLYLEDVFVCEANSNELLEGGTYEDCKRVLEHHKLFVDQGHSELPF